MDGIINILKPPGMTSHDVVLYIRHLIGIKKVGHTGTLDPDAAGVLPVCIGRATKIVEYISNNFKKYRVELKLGITTTTGDEAGEILTQKDWRLYINENNIYDNIKNLLSTFLGKSLQIPPMYSAVKIKGKKLYELARQGQEIERKPREIEILEITPIDISLNEGTILFDVVCSKGTYIRALCEDIGKKIGCGAYMSFLERLEVSSFNINNAWTLEQIYDLVNNNKLNQAIISIESYFSNISMINIKNNLDQKRLINGKTIYLERNKFDIKTELVRIYFDQKFTGLGKVEYGLDKIKLRFEKILFC